MVAKTRLATTMAATKKKVLFLGAAGLIGPYLTPGLVGDYDLRLTDVKQHPDGIEVEHVDVTDYAQVLKAAQGMDAIMNFTVNRNDADLSFHVNTCGAWHVMRAAAELGIRKVVHSGPQAVRSLYDHDFDVDQVASRPSTGLYGTTKLLSAEICRAYARTHGIQVISFLFNGLHDSPSEPIKGRDFPVMSVVWDDLIQACKQALELESVPGGYQEFNLHSHLGHEKYSLERAREILGFEPKPNMAEFYRRPVSEVA